MALAIIAFCALLAQGCEQKDLLPANLLQNGSFEHGFDGWTLREGLRPAFAKSFPGDPCATKMRPITFALKPKHFDSPIAFDYFIEEMKGNLAKLVVRFKVKTKDDKEIILSYLLYGTNDFWAAENVVNHGVLCITHHVQGAPRQANTLSIDGIQTEIARFIAKNHPPGFSPPQIKSASVSIEIWSEKGEEPLRAYFSGLRPYMGPQWKALTQRSITAPLFDIADHSPANATALDTFFFQPTDGARCFNSNITVARLDQRVETTPGAQYLLVFDTKSLLGINGPYVEIRTPDDELAAWTKLPISITQHGWTRGGLLFTAPGESVTISIPTTAAAHRQSRFANLYDNMRLYGVSDETIDPLLQHFGLTRSPSGLACHPIPFEEFLSPEFITAMNTEIETLGLPVYDIIVDENALWDESRIAQRHQDAVTKMQPGYANMQPAQLVIDGGPPVDVRIKTRGFGIGHHIARTRSWRVNFSKNSRIDLIRPLCRSFIGEAWAQRVAGEIGLAPMLNSFVYLRMNHKPVGLMWRIDRSRKSLEVACRPDGSVTDLTVLLSDDLTYVAEPYPIDTIASFDIKASKDFRNRYDTGQLIDAMSQTVTNHDFEAFSLLVDTDNLVDIDVLSTLLSSSHIDWMHNDVLYWNTACGRFELLPYDVRIQNIKVPEMFLRHNPFIDFVTLRPEGYLAKTRKLWNLVSSEAFLNSALAELDTLHAATAPAHDKSVTYGYRGMEFMEPKLLTRTYGNQKALFSKRTQTIRHALETTQPHGYTLRHIGRDEQGRLRHLLTVTPRAPLTLPTQGQINVYYQDAFILSDADGMSPSIISEIRTPSGSRCTVAPASRTLPTADEASARPMVDGIARPNALLLPDLHRQLGMIILWKYQYEHILRTITDPQDKDLFNTCYTRKGFPYHPKPMPFLWMLTDEVRNDPTRLRRLNTLLERYGILPPRAASFIITSDTPLSPRDVSVAMVNAVNGNAVPCPTLTTPAIAVAQDSPEAETSSSRKGDTAHVYRTPLKHFADITLNVNAFVARHPTFTMIDERTVTLDAGIHRLGGVIVVPTGIELVIAPGATLEMDEGASLVAYGPITAKGTAQRPIVIRRLDPTRPWGTLAMLRKASGGAFEHCHISGGTEAYVNGTYFSAMVAAHYADATFRHCTFEDASKGGGDDSLNVKFGHAVVESCTFANNGADAVDLDLVRAGSVISGCTFRDNANDGADISGSHVRIADTLIEGHGDKGISGGEASTLTVENCVIRNCSQGMAAKDRTRLTATGTTIADCKTGATAYQKKAIFGGGTLVLEDCTLAGNRMDIGVQDFKSDNAKPSHAYLVETDFRRTGRSTTEIIREPKRKLSKKKFILASAEGTLGEYGYRFATLTDRVNITSAASRSDIPDLETMHADGAWRTRSTP